MSVVGEFIRLVISPLRSGDGAGSPPEPKDKDDKKRTGKAAKEAAEDSAKAREEEATKDAEAQAGEHVVRDRILKLVGGVVAGLGTTAVVGVIGAAVLWIRFQQAGLPAVQAVNVQPQHEALVQGAQTTIIFLLLALVGVLLAYFATLENPRELSWWGCLLLSPLLLAAIVYVGTTGLSGWWKLALALLAIALYVGCLEVGRHVRFPFWALAISVFAASLVFSTATGFLIVQQQKFLQPVAVLRGGEDAGLTGFYVAVDGEELYFAQTIGAPGASPESRAMHEVPLGEEVTYAVGPLQSVTDAERSAAALLARLVADREAATAGGPGATTATASLPSWVSSNVAATFNGRMEAHETTPEQPLCLMRYLKAGTGKPKSNWWTSCGEAEVETSVSDARDRFALPRRFQPEYDQRAKVEVLAETALRYVDGETAPQCGGGPGQPCGYRYPGGGLQYWFEEPEALPEPALECTQAEPDRASDWQPCPSP